MNHRNLSTGRKLSLTTESNQTLKSNTNKISELIKNETEIENLFAFVDKLQKERSEKLRKINQVDKPFFSNPKSGEKKPSYFWVKQDNKISNEKCGDFDLIKQYTQMNTEEPEDNIKTDRNFKTIVDNVSKELKRSKQYLVLKALIYLIEFDKKIKPNGRNTIREHPKMFTFLRDELERISNIRTQNDLMKEIMGLVDLVAKISHMSDAVGWVWIIKIILVDIINLCETIDTSGEHSQLSAMLHLMTSRQILLIKDNLSLCFNMVQFALKRTIRHQDWLLPKHYLHLVQNKGDSNMFEECCILYYHVIVNINKTILESDNVVFDNEILNTYALSLRAMRYHEIEDSVLALYELIDLCKESNDMFFSCMAYSHLSNCFFALRQTHTAYLYLDLMLRLAEENSLYILQVLAHRQLAMVATCDGNYDLGLSHLKAALELGGRSKYIEQELVHEMDDIRACIGEVNARYRMSHAEFSLEETLGIDLTISWSIYENEN